MCRLGEPIRSFMGFELVLHFFSSMAHCHLEKNPVVRKQ